MAGRRCRTRNPSRNSELASFGEELRREREIRGISLKEIADATKISKRFLDAIERNDHKTLPAPVFTRGFVREYARYLGLNADEMVNRYNFAAVGDDRIEQSAHLERLTTPQAPPPPRKKPPPKGIPPAYARVDRNVYILIIVVIALAGVSYWALKHRRETRANEERLAAETKAAAPAPVAAPPPAPVADREHLDAPPAAVPAQTDPEPRGHADVVDHARRRRRAPDQRGTAPRLSPHLRGEGRIPIQNHRQRRRRDDDAERRARPVPRPRRPGPARRRLRSRRAAETADPSAPTQQ